MSAHAKLSPSSARGWITCADCVNANDGLPDDVSDPREIAKCPYCEGNGWYPGEEAACCQRFEWECGGRGCSGPVQVQTQVQCERCYGAALEEGD